MAKIIVILFSIFIMSVDSYASDFPAKEIYARFAPSVVVIKASDGSGAGMIGSGSIISNDGMVITNAHVVIAKESEKPYSRIIVYVKPENKASVSDDDLSKYFEAEVVHYADELDLAMLKLKGFDVRANIIEFADPAEIGAGEEVVAIGHPEQGGFWSLTYGRISGEIRDYQGIKGKDVFQTDTSVNRGNSGGPLLDKRGYMVAVNSNIARIGKGGLPITGVKRPRERRRENGLADAGVGSGNDEASAHAGSLDNSSARCAIIAAICCSLACSVKAMRSRAVSSGTVGGLMARMS